VANPSYLRMIAVPVPKGLPALAPARRVPMRNDEQRVPTGPAIAAPPEPPGRREANVVSRDEHHDEATPTDAASFDLPAAIAAPRHAAEPGSMIAGVDRVTVIDRSAPSPVVQQASPSAGRQALRPTTASVDIPGTSASVEGPPSTIAPAPSSIPDAPRAEPIDVEASHVEPPDADVWHAGPEAPAAPAIRHTTAASQGTPPVRQERRNEEAPQLIAPPPAATPRPDLRASVEIGSIEVRVVHRASVPAVLPAPPPIASAPAAAPPRGSTLARGLVSRYGFDQG
jgi:hypothetical protein